MKNDAKMRIHNCYILSFFKRIDY